MKNYKYYEEVKRGIENKVEGEKIVDAIEKDRDAYFMEILKRGGYKPRET